VSGGAGQDQAGRYARQTLLFPHGAADQARLARARLLVLGLGALGSTLADLLVRAGVGFVRLVDRDVVELSNLHRQALYDEADAREGRPKAIAAADRLSAVNVGVQLEPLAVDFDADNAESLLTDVDLALDATDNFEARYLLNEAAVKLGRSWIYSAVVGSYGATTTIRPGQSPCLRCVFPVQPAPGSTPTCETAGILGPIAALIGSIAAAEALKLLIGAEQHLRPGLLWADLWAGSFQTTPLPALRADCPVCQRHRFELLDRPAARSTASLCGRNAVQVRPSVRRAVDLPALAARLAPIGEVRCGAHLLRFRAGDHELTVFPDGRAIVRGTEDPATARQIYARYIGA
jgi:adenylyltransferase/sulfurtransferase